jgi:surface protein
MWDTGNVTDMAGMFAQAREFNGDIGSWDTRKVKNMRNMFEGAIKFNRDIGKWDTSKVTNTSSMFNGATAFNQNLSTWKLSSVKDVREHTQLMFAGSGMETDKDRQPESVRSMQLEITLFGQPSLRSYV